MSRNVFEIEAGLLGFSTTEPTHADAIADAVIGDYTAFSCQVTTAALNAKSNTTNKTTPATWCEPEATQTIVGVTSYEIAATFLQDPHIEAGISEFLYANDTVDVWFFMGFAAAGAPKVIGKCTAAAGSIGGEARTPLTFQVTLPCKGKPTVQFGSGGSTAIVGGPATGAVAGIPGHYTPTGADPPASVADLIAGTPEVVVASPLTAWTTGQYITTGDGDKAHWSSTAWVAGIA